MGSTNRLVQKGICGSIASPLLLILLIASMSSFCSLALEEEEGKTQRVVKEAVAGTKVGIIEVAKSLFSQPTTRYFRFLPKFVRTSLKQTWPSCFPSPNLDFRGGERQGKSEEEGARKKVKEAVVRSLDESKAMVEDSARSAAHVVDNTLKRLKKTLSGKPKGVKKEEELAAEL